MEFLEQSKSFQNSLIKKSRLFTTIMLASGIGLVAAAPFLSYEATNIQCYEKSENIIIVNVTDTVVLKSQLQREEMNRNSMQKQIRDLQKGMDCSELLENLEVEKEILQEKLLECEKELNECLSKDDGSGVLKDKIKGLEKAITQLKNDNDELIEALEKCESGSNTGNERLSSLQSKVKTLNDEIDRLRESLNECLENGKDESSNMDGIIKEYEAQVNDLNDKIALYKKRWKKCEREAKAVASPNVHLEFDLYNNHAFSFNKSTFYLKQNGEGEGVYCELIHNGNFSLSNYGPSTGPYLFEDSGNQYELKIIDTSYEFYSLEINSK